MLPPRACQHNEIRHFLGNPGFARSLRAQLRLGAYDAIGAVQPLCGRLQSVRFDISRYVAPRYVAPRLCGVQTRHACSQAGSCHCSTHRHLLVDEDDVEWRLRGVCGKDHLQSLKAVGCRLHLQALNPAKDRAHDLEVHGDVVHGQNAQRAE